MARMFGTLLSWVAWGVIVVLGLFLAAALGFFLYSSVTVFLEE